MNKKGEEVIYGYLYSGLLHQHRQNQGILATKPENSGRRKR